MSKEDFYELTPDHVLNAVELAGFQPTGEFTQLNSYENRVFDIRLENKERVIAKFYRPGRWSQQTILEEHEFLNDLKLSGLPAIAPLQLQNGSTLDIDNNIWFALWPKAVGRMVDELSTKDFEKLGRTLARFHNVGEQKRSPHRPIMNAENYGWQNLDILESWIAPEVIDRYFSAASHSVEFLEKHLSEKSFIRIHGDCHRGNILKTDVRSHNEISATTTAPQSEFFFVDFDDCAMGHPAQDFWMLLSAGEETDEGQKELQALLTGYKEFRKFDDRDLQLIPALRALRIIHYAAWIARRWEDPSFPKLFPQYTDYSYWAAETDALEKIADMLEI
ncbi:MAG: serine/threonine protein kinase [Bdellovibrionales bacterium]|nr:serine/threonine protein kinase [Bdellovibrionales bacterium]